MFELAIMAKQNKKRTVDEDAEGDNTGRAGNSAAMSGGTVTARRSLDFHSCVGCDSVQPKPKKQRKGGKTESGKKGKKKAQVETSAAVNYESEVKELNSEDENTDNITIFEPQDQNNSVVVDFEGTRKEAEDDEEEERPERSKFQNERSDLHRSTGANSNAAQEGSVNIVELIEDEDDEVLEEVYLKVQRRLAEKKKLKEGNRDSLKPSTSKQPVAMAAEGTNQNNFTADKVNEEIEKIRRGQNMRAGKVGKNALNEAIRGCDSVTTVYTRACKQSKRLKAAQEKTAAGSAEGTKQGAMATEINDNSDESQVLYSSNELNTEFDIDNMVHVSENLGIAEAENSGPDMREMQAHLWCLSDHHEARD